MVRIAFIRLLAGASLSWATVAASVAQVMPAAAPAAADTTHKFENPAGVSSGVKKPFFQSKLFKAVAIPTVLITYGALTARGDAGINHRERVFVQKQFRPVSTGFDNTLIVVPYLELGLVALAGVESRDDRINTLLIIAKGEAIMLASTFGVKYLSREQRPNHADNLSFPSGHTAQAFLAASIVHTEFRDKSQWYGIGAYTLATSVAALRMINDKHWQSDVVAGAGFGILSAHLAYLSHRNRWGRKSVGRDIGKIDFTPSWTPYGGTGLSLTWHPKK